MRVVIHGAGAIGGWLGFRLAKAGADVALIARGPHLAAIRAEGLTLEEASGAETLRLTASDDPAEIGPCDLVIYGVKAHQLDAALAGSDPLIGPGTRALSTQNGVDAPDRIAARFGPERTLIGVARVSAEITAPGRIGELVLVSGFPVGAYADGRQDGMASDVVALLRDAGVAVPETEDVRVQLWQKFVGWNAASAAVGARLPGAVARRAPEYRAFSAKLAWEAVAVGKAAGAPVTDAMAEAVEASVAKPAKPGSKGIRPSMLLDLELGKPLELDHLVGAVSRMGAELGVPTPCSDAVTALLAPWRDGPPEGP